MGGSLARTCKESLGQDLPCLPRNKIFLHPCLARLFRVIIDVGSSQQFRDG
jgi:hypothetical protein